MEEEYIVKLQPEESKVNPLGVIGIIWKLDRKGINASLSGGVISLIPLIAPLSSKKFSKSGFTGLHVPSFNIIHNIVAAIIYLVNN